MFEHTISGSVGFVLGVLTLRFAQFVADVFRQAKYNKDLENTVEQLRRHVCREAGQRDVGVPVGREKDSQN